MQVDRGADHAVSPRFLLQLSMTVQQASHHPETRQRYFDQTREIPSVSPVQDEFPTQRFLRERSLTVRRYPRASAQRQITPEPKGRPITGEAPRVQTGQRPCCSQPSPCGTPLWRRGWKTSGNLAG